LPAIAIAILAEKNAVTERLAKEEVQTGLRRRSCGLAARAKGARELRRNFELAVNQTSTTVNLFHGPEFQLFQNDPVYQTVSQLCCRAFAGAQGDREGRSRRPAGLRYRDAQSLQQADC